VHYLEGGVLFYKDNQMDKKEYLNNFDWENFHYTCSNCNLPVESGKEAYHTNFLCDEMIEESKYNFGTKEMKEYGLIMSNKLRIEIMYRQRGKCASCGIEEWKLKKKLHAHRIYPGEKGGRYISENVILLCPKCHYRRHHEQR
jgi:Zn finger protein HypA/HybF involved in hydrogenase expression